MLIQNDTQIVFTLRIKLVFDNSTTEVAEVGVNDYLLMKFKYNGMKISRACRVVEIRPIVLDTQPVSYAAEFIVDCSSTFSAERLRVSCKDILDIRVVDKDYVDSLAPDYEITDEMLRADRIPPTPEDKTESNAVSVAGVGRAEILR